MAWTCDTDERPTGRPKDQKTNRTTQLRFKDVCKRDLQALGINTDSWKVTATDRDAWRHTVNWGYHNIKKHSE